MTDNKVVKNTKFSTLKTKVKKFRKENLLQLRIKFLIMLNMFVTLEFNKLTAENFTARLKQVDLVSKTDFDNKLTSFNRKTTSNKTKKLEAQKNKKNKIK